jgi:hypothetical protein
MWRICAACLIALSLWSSSLRGHAYSQSDSEAASRPAYRELVRKALQEYALGNWAEARVYFSDAHTMYPNARTFRGLGMTCYEARNYVEAIEFLEQALSSTEQPLTQKLAAESRKILEQAQRFVVRLVLTVEPRDAQVTLDSRPLPRRTNGAILLDPGSHELQATASGFVPDRRTVLAMSGEPLQVSIQLRSEQVGESRSAPGDNPRPPPADPAAPAPAPPIESLANQLPGAAVAAGIAGVGAFAVGWGFYAARQNLRTDLNPEPPLSSIQHYNTYGVVTLSVAGAGAALLSLAELFWLPDDPSIPAWAWVAGAAGLAVVAVGAVLAFVGQPCVVHDSRVECQSATRDRFFGPFLAIHAVPLITLPIMYALRPRNGQPPPVQVSMSFGGAARELSPTLQVSGRF